MATDADKQLALAYFPAFRDQDWAWWEAHIAPEGPHGSAAAGDLRPWREIMVRRALEFVLLRCMYAHRPPSRASRGCFVSCVADWADEACVRAGGYWPQH